MVRVGVDASIDAAVLADFSNASASTGSRGTRKTFSRHLSPMPPRILHAVATFEGRKGHQGPWPGVDTLLKLFPPE